MELDYIHYVNREIWMLHGKHTLLPVHQNDIDIFFPLYIGSIKFEIIYAVALSENLSIIYRLYLCCLSILR